MPAGPRIRDNNVFGLTTDNPLTAGAGTFNSAGLANLSVVASAHAVVTLDPIRQFGEPEIVVVTVHTAAATVATISRGQYGTVARAHPVNTLWVHQPIDEDFTELVSSSAVITNPYEGQPIYDYTLNKLLMYTGTDWAPRDSGGQLGYAQVVANQVLTATADLTSLTSTVTVGTGRRIRVTGHVRYNNENAAANRTELIIMQDGVQVQNYIMGLTANATNGEDGAINCQVVLSPSAGSHTYKLQGSASLFNVTMIATATVPAFILVEDIGAA